MRYLESFFLLHLVTVPALHPLFASDIKSVGLLAVSWHPPWISQVGGVESEPARCSSAVRFLLHFECNATLRMSGTQRCRSGDDTVELALLAAVDKATRVIGRGSLLQSFDFQFLHVSLLCWYVG